MDKETEQLVEIMHAISLFIYNNRRVGKTTFLKESMESFKNKDKLFYIGSRYVQTRDFMSSLSEETRNNAVFSSLNTMKPETLRGIHDKILVLDHEAISHLLSRACSTIAALNDKNRKLEEKLGDIRNILNE